MADDKARPEQPDTIPFYCGCGVEYAALDLRTGVLKIVSRHGGHRHTNTIAVDMLVKMLYGSATAVINFGDMLKPQTVIDKQP
jgi:hypothetical protein